MLKGDVADHYDTAYINVKSQDVFYEFSSFLILFLALKTQKETRENGVDVRCYVFTGFGNIECSRETVSGKREIVNGIKRQTKCNVGGRERWRSEREAQDLAAL